MYITFRCTGWKYFSCFLFPMLATQAHVVAAFEHSLTNMTNRLQKLTATSEQKVNCP